jgi:hypothetical protein
MTSVLEGGGQHHAPAALPPGKTRYPLYRRLGVPQGQSERVQKISPPPGFFFFAGGIFLLFQIQVTSFSFLLYSLYKPLQEAQSYAGL